MREGGRVALSHAHSPSCQELGRHRNHVSIHGSSMSEENEKDEEEEEEGRTGVVDGEDTRRKGRKDGKEAL